MGGSAAEGGRQHHHDHGQEHRDSHPRPTPRSASGVRDEPVAPEDLMPSSHISPLLIVSSMMR
jgi:hypothetical protein